MTEADVVKEIGRLKEEIAIRAVQLVEFEARLKNKNFEDYEFAPLEDDEDED